MKMLITLRNEMKISNSKGFTVVEIMLIILAVAAVGGLGVYVFNSRPKPQQETTPSPTTSKVTEEPAAATKEEVVTAESGAGFLIIEQLGIKIPLNGITKSDIEYTIGSVEGKNYAVAYVSSKSLKETLIAEHIDYFTKYAQYSPDYGSASLVMIPTADFDIDGRTSYPGDGGEWDKQSCQATIGDNELCVMRNFVDLGEDYGNFVQSVSAASKNAVSL